MEYRRDYVVRLPLPLAQLYSRAFNAKDARSRHDNAYYLFEALIKLAASPLIGRYAWEVKEGRPRVPALDKDLLQLALPSLGHWVSILRELSRHFANAPDASSHPLGRIWTDLSEPRRDKPGLLALYRRIKNGVDGKGCNEQSCTILDVLEALVQYRNSVFGHGGPRFDSFFANDMGPLLLPAINDLLEEGTFDPLGPRGSRLVYITDLRTIDEDSIEVGLRELVGLAAERLAPLMLTRTEARQLLPNRVGVLWPGQSSPALLDPLLLYRESETAEEVLFLNRDRNQRDVEFLSYASGRTERDKSTSRELARFLTIFAGREVAEGELQRLIESSTEEGPGAVSFRPAQTIGQRQGDYELLAEIGRGGMGVVYLARQLSMGRLVSLKMLPSDLAGDSVALARFRREIQHLAHCEHPNIVKVLSSGTMPDGRLFYTMEYVPGCDLEQVWKELGGGPDSGYPTSRLGQSTWAKAVLSASHKRREETSRRRRSTAGSLPKDKANADELPALPLPPLPELPSTRDDPGGYVRRVCVLMRDVAMAVQTVHEQRIVHRDIKPANIMLTPDGSRAVLMDFGLAKGESMALTASVQAGFLGTLRYAAPEQMAGGKIKVGPTADVRALGCVLWEMLTGRRLFGECQDEAALAMRVLNTDVPRLRSVDKAFDRDLEAIVARATERAVGDRTQTAAQVAQQLQLYLDHKPLSIRPPTGRELFMRWCKTNRLAASLVAAVGVLLFVSAVGASTLSLVARSHARRADENAKRAEMEAEHARLSALLAEQERQRATEEQKLAVHEKKLAEQAALRADLEAKKAEEQRRLAQKNAELAEAEKREAIANLQEAQKQRKEAEEQKSRAQKFAYEAQREAARANEKASEADQARKVAEKERQYALEKQAEADWASRVAVTEKQKAEKATQQAKAEQKKAEEAAKAEKKAQEEATKLVAEIGQLNSKLRELAREKQSANVPGAGPSDKDTGPSEKVVKADSESGRPSIGTKESSGIQPGSKTVSADRGPSADDDAIPSWRDQVRTKPRSGKGGASSVHSLRSRPSSGTLNAFHSRLPSSRSYSSKPGAPGAKSPPAHDDYNSLNRELYRKLEQLKRVNPTAEAKMRKQLGLQPQPQRPNEE